MLALAVLGAVFAEASIYKEFQQFTHEFDKAYDTIEEYTQAFENFKINKNIESLNRKRKSISYETGVTKFWDMTFEEFQRTYLNLKLADVESFLADATTFQSNGDLKADAAFDWRNKSAVGPIKNQGSCGSCWAFAAGAAVESAYFIKYKQLKQFSEQQFVDCDTTSHGCGGGWSDSAFNTAKRLGGLMLQADYPYEARQGACRFNATKVATKINGTIVPGTSNEATIRDFLFDKGPLAIYLNANPLNSYRTGIIDVSAADCSPSGMNHAVTLVGYGNESGKDFWIVKNSWGTNWGEQGYFRIARGKNTCGVGNWVYAPIIL